MSTKNFSENITTRYGEPEKDIYQQVIDLVEKERIAKSRAQLLLVQRGLAHMGNPEPLIKEKVVYRDREVPVEKIVEKVVYKSPPKVDKSTQEYVAMDDHIRGDLQNTGQRASADKLTTRDKADPPSSSSIALKEKKSAKKKDGISGWAIAGGLSLVGVLIYWLVK